MNTSLKIIISSLVAVFIGASIASWFAPAPVPQYVAPLGSVENRITGSMTNTSSTVATTGTSILAIPAGLQYLRIDNNTAFNVYCSLSSAAATSTVPTTAGRRLGAVATTTIWGQSYMELGPDTMLNFVGYVNCISVGGTGTVLLQYK